MADVRSVADERWQAKPGGRLGVLINTAEFVNTHADERLYDAAAPPVK